MMTTIETHESLARIFAEWLKSADEDDERAEKLAWISAKNLLKKARGG